MCTFISTPLAICNTHKQTGSRSRTRRALMRIVDRAALPSDTELQPLELDGQWLRRNANYLKYPRRDNWEDCIRLDCGESAEKQWELSEMSSEQIVRVQTGLFILGTNNATLDYGVKLCMHGDTPVLLIKFCGSWIGSKVEPASRYQKVVG